MFNIYQYFCHHETAHHQFVDEVHLFDVVVELYSENERVRVLVESDVDLDEVEADANVRVLFLLLLMLVLEKKTECF